jgi:hypothetical protein
VQREVPAPVDQLPAPGGSGNFSKEEVDAIISLDEQLDNRVPSFSFRCASGSSCLNAFVLNVSGWRGHFLSVDERELGIYMCSVQCICFRSSGVASSKRLKIRYFYTDSSKCVYVVQCVLFIRIEHIYIQSVYSSYVDCLLSENACLFQRIVLALHLLL